MLPGSLYWISMDDQLKKIISLSDVSEEITGVAGWAESNSELDGGLMKQR